ncbi:MAG: HAD family hydrolase [Proteobacteria bacterium]|nr:HAD family hydrolase [Pseudomonadota bacterium]
MAKIKAVFIDRDGTINVDKSYVYKIEDFELLPGSLEALKLLTRHKIKIYIVTNQAGIAKGLYTEKQYHVLTEYMLNFFKKGGIKIEKVLYCPHHPEGIVPEYTRNCNCRKPNTKLFEDVIQQNEYHKSELILIGDKNSDIEAGNRLDIITYLVQTGYGREHQTDMKATYIEKDLLSVVKHIISATS